MPRWFLIAIVIAALVIIGLIVLDPLAEVVQSFRYFLAAIFVAAMIIAAFPGGRRS
jgi:hypothetical protein